MASNTHNLHFLVIFLSLLCTFFGSSESHYTSKPSLLVLPVQKDASTGLHWAYVHKRTPLVKLPVLVDLEGKFLWLNCETNYLSSTYKAPFCHSTQCSIGNTHYCRTCSSDSKPGCHNNTCAVISRNPVTQRTGVGELAEDVLAINQATTTDAFKSKLGPMMTIPRFLFACAPSFLLQKDLPKNVQGVAGLDHAPIALPTQLAAHFGLQRKFTMCLSGSPISKLTGAVLFGDVPHNLLPGIDISSDLVDTPLAISPQGEYLIQVTSIKINKQSVPISIPSLSPVHKRALGGVMISTTSPYTVLHHTIFAAVTQALANQLPKGAQVKAVPPFGLCFDTKKITGTNSSIDLVLDKSNVVWRISGENLMKEARPGVSCLSFVDGGLNPRAAIVIGTHQLQDNLVRFDLVRSRIGFSSSLHMRATNCANFNFTTIDTPHSLEE